MSLNASPFNAAPLNAPGGIPTIVTEADGWRAAQFGTPYATNTFRAQSLGRVVNFGTPSTPTFLQAQAQGWRTVHFGIPYGSQPFMFGPENVTVQAQGWRAARFGLATAQINFAGEATGWRAAVMVPPKLVHVGQTANVGPAVRFGVPSVTSVHRPSGWRAAAFGTPTSGVAYVAQSLRPVRFGVPRLLTPGALVAQGWRAVRFGVPSVVDQLGALKAEGFRAVQFGMPSALNIHRAQTIGRVVRFGRPTLRRNPTC